MINKYKIIEKHFFNFNNHFSLLAGVLQCLAKQKFDKHLWRRHKFAMASFQLTFISFRIFINHFSKILYWWWQNHWSPLQHIPKILSGLRSGFCSGQSICENDVSYSLNHSLISLSLHSSLVLLPWVLWGWNALTSQNIYLIADHDLFQPHFFIGDDGSPLSSKVLFCLLLGFFFNTLDNT